MNFIVEFLRSRPEATYQEVRSAGAEANFQVAPINYGNARRMLGMAAKTRVTGRTRNRRPRAEVETTGNAETATVITSRRGRGRKRKLDFSNLSNLVAELQDVVAERDRLLAALDQIADIIRKV
jgi:hypothetical protein